MLSSIILSMAMSVSPAPVADANNLDIEEISAKRGTRRLSENKNLNIEVVSAKRGTRRLSNNNNLNVESASAKRGTRRF
jgi:hypothetical protein